MLTLRCFAGPCLRLSSFLCLESILAAPPILTPPPSLSVVTLSYRSEGMAQSLKDGPGGVASDAPLAGKEEEEEDALLPVVVEQTVDIFSKFSTTEKMKMRLKVTFQTSQDEANGRRVGQVRRRLIANAAEDQGGLLVEWLDDFCENVRTHLVPLNLFAPRRLSSSEGLVGDDSNDDSIPAFSVMNNARHYLPSRLASPAGDPIQLQAAGTSDKAADQQRKALLALYETVGKVLNQMIREGMPLPEAFGSPLLLGFLLGGCDGLGHRPEYTTQDLREMVLDVDYETYGGGGGGGGGGDSSGSNQVQQEVAAALTRGDKKAFHETIIKKYVYQPRLAALEAIKRGFDLFPRVGHRLRELPLNVIQAEFVGAAVVWPHEVLLALDFERAFEGDDKRGTESLLPEFKAIVSNAIEQMDPDQCRSFLKFATGSGQLHKSVRVTVLAKPVFAEAASRFPEGPLSTSLTCCSQVTVPLPVELGGSKSPAGRSGLPRSGGSSSSSSSNSSSSIGRVSVGDSFSSSSSTICSTGGGDVFVGAAFTAANVYKNLKESIKHGNSPWSEFSDRGALSVGQGR